MESVLSWCHKFLGWFKFGKYQVNIRTSAAECVSSYQEPYQDTNAMKCASNCFKVVNSNTFTCLLCCKIQLLEVQKETKDIKGVQNILFST